jgi:hypothetical protein
MSLFGSDHPQRAAIDFGGAREPHPKPAQRPVDGRGISVDQVVYVRVRVTAVGGPGDWWAFETETVGRSGQPDDASIVNVVRDPSHLLTAAEIRRIAEAGR